MDKYIFICGHNFTRSKFGADKKFKKINWKKYL